MGYEALMLIVKKTRLPRGIVLVDDKVYNLYTDEDTNGASRMFYYNKDSIKTPVPTMARTKSGPYCQILATIDLAKPGFTIPGICKFEESDGHHVYDPFDGNKLLSLDGYGDYRKFIPAQDVLNILKDQYQKESYRRVLMAIVLLKATIESHPNEEIGCLFYGH
jgi:hypothetical protein